MSKSYDLNAFAREAMLANQTASRAFIVRNMTATLNAAGQETTAEDVGKAFDAMRPKVGWKYKGAPMPLQNNAAAKLQADPPTKQGKEEDDGAPKVTLKLNVDLDLEDTSALNGTTIYDGSYFGSSVLGDLLGKAMNRDNPRPVARITDITNLTTDVSMPPANSAVVDLSISENGLVLIDNVVAADKQIEQLVRMGLFLTYLPEGTMTSSGTLRIQVDFGEETESADNS